MGIFIMFNTVPHKSHPEGPSFDETKFILEREANAPLFVFDTVNFQRFGPSVGRIIGQTERKLYTSTNLRGITSKDLEMPSYSPKADSSVTTSRTPNRRQRRCSTPSAPG